jgi:hypothetical protein
MPDPLFDDLFQQTAHLRWSSPADVVRRGRQRRRQVLLTAAGSVVLVLSAAGGVIAATGQGPAPLPPAATQTPSPAPTSSPSPAPTTPPSPSPSSSSPSAAGPEIPTAALLRVSDLTPGFQVAQPGEQGDGSIASLSIYCRNPYQGFRRPLAENDRRFVRGRQAQAESVHETVQRYPGATAQDYLDQKRSWLSNCQPHRPDDRLTVIAEGFTGDASLLVESNIEGVRTMWALVRQGDLVAELRMKPVDRSELLRLADRAAQRLCLATNTC